MMQGLLLPGWALIGGLFTAAVFGAGHYWIQSYWGGAVATLASALMVGAFVRIMRRGRRGFIWLLAAGSALGLLTRPYECGVLAAALIIALIVIHVRSRSWIALRNLMLPYSCVMAAWAAFQMYYDWRVTGNPLKLPYILHEQQYSVAPSFWIFPLRNVPRPSDPVIYGMHWTLEKSQYEELRNTGWVRKAAILLRRSITGDLCGYRSTVPDLLGPVFHVLALTPVFWFSRRVRFLAALAGVIALSTCLVVWTFLHYLAPFVPIALALTFLLSAYARTLKVGRRRAGNILVAIILLCLALPPLLIAHSAIANFINGGDIRYVKDRAHITAQLNRTPGRHLVLVHYKPENKQPRPDWVYNAANIDAQKIVWARDRGAVENRKLLAYYHDRRVWMLYADESPVRIEPYRD